MSNTPAERREVGVQAEVELVDRSASTSSLVGPPGCQSGSSPVPPALPAPVAPQPTGQHVCKIDIELRGQSLLPFAQNDNKAMSLPASMRAYSFERNSSSSSPGPGSKPPRRARDGGVRKDEQETGEEDGRGETRNKPHADRPAEEEAGAEQKEEKKREGDKPQQVAWDEQVGLSLLNPFCPDFEI